MYSELSRSLWLCVALLALPASATAQDAQAAPGTEEAAADEGGDSEPTADAGEGNWVVETNSAALDDQAEQVADEETYKPRNDFAAWRLRIDVIAGAAMEAGLKRQLDDEDLETAEDLIASPLVGLTLNVNLLPLDTVSLALGVSGRVGWWGTKDARRGVDRFNDRVRKDGGSNFVDFKRDMVLDVLLRPTLRVPFGDGAFHVAVPVGLSMLFQGLSDEEAFSAEPVNDVASITRDHGMGLAAGAAMGASHGLNDWLGIVWELGYMAQRLPADVAVTDDDGVVATGELISTIHSFTITAGVGFGVL